MDVKKLIEEVLTDLGNNTPLSSVASKVQIIARLLKNDVFNSWVSKEFLTGYEKGVDLPSYRKTMSPAVKADYMSYDFGGVMSFPGQTVPMMNLGNRVYSEVMEIRMYDPLPIIDDLCKNKESLVMSLSAYEQSCVQKVLGDMQIKTCHKVIPLTFLPSIIETVKSKLIDAFMDFDEQLFDNSIDFNAISKKDEIQGIVNNYFVNAGAVNTGLGNVTVKDSTFVTGNSNAITNDLKAIVDRIDELAQEVDEDRSDIAEAIAQIRQELNQKKPNRKILKMCFNALKGLLKKSVESGIEELVEKGIEKINLFG